MGRSDLPRTILTRLLINCSMGGNFLCRSTSGYVRVVGGTAVPTVGRYKVVGGRCHDVLPIPHTPRHSACSAAVVPTGVRSCAAVAAVGAVHVQGGVGRGWCLKHKQESQTTATRLRTQPTSRGPPSAWAAAAQHLSMR